MQTKNIYPFIFQALSNALNTWPCLLYFTHAVIQPVYHILSTVQLRSVNTSKALWVQHPNRTIFLTKTHSGIYALSLTTTLTSSSNTKLHPQMEFTNGFQTTKFKSFFPHSHLAFLVSGNTGVAAS